MSLPPALPRRAALLVVDAFGVLCALLVFSCRRAPDLSSCVEKSLQAHT